MDTRRLRWWYRATEPLADAADIRVELADRRPSAHIRREEHRDGQPRWAWTGGGLHDFHVEAEASGPSFLVTDAHGAPFGRIRQRGLLRPRLVASDADAERFTAGVDGRITSCAGDRPVLGWMDLHPRRLRLDAPGDGDVTLRHLLAAVPLCHAVQVLLLEA